MIATTSQRRTARSGEIGAQNVYIAISGYRSLSQSLSNIFIELAIVENAAFAVVILKVIASCSVSHYWNRLRIPSWGYFSPKRNAKVKVEPLSPKNMSRQTLTVVLPITRFLQKISPRFLCQKFHHKMR